MFRNMAKHKQKNVVEARALSFIQALQLIWRRGPVDSISGTRPSSELPRLIE